MSLANPPARPKPAQPNEFLINLVFVGAIFGVILSIAIVVAPVVFAAISVFFLIKLTGMKWWWVALAAAAAFLILHILGLSPVGVIEQVCRRATRISERKGFGEAVQRIWNHKGKWWLRTLPALPIGALIGALATSLLDARYPWWHPRVEIQRVQELVVSRERAAARNHKSPDTIKGLAVLGPHASGDLGHPWVSRHRRHEFLSMHPTVLGRHVVVVGKPGSGKTVTLLRLAYLAAKVYGWRVYFLDGKGDIPTMHEFVALMLAAGVPAGEIGTFPTQPLDGWRVSGTFQQGYSQLLNRLMGALHFSEPYYRDMTRRYLSLALRMGDGLPQSSSELVERLTRLANEAPTEEKREALGARNRFESLFDSFPGQFDGGWSFSDYRAGYVLLKGLSNREEAKNAAGYLFECFKQFTTDMKEPRDRILLVVDEFPAVMGDSDAAGMIERLRSFGCGVALSAQNYEGLGDDRRRIIEAAGTLMLHRLSDSDDLARLAGTIQAYTVTTQVDFSDGSTGRGTITPEHRFKVEPNAVGQQRDGEITLIADRRAAHGFVTRIHSDESLQAAAHDTISNLRSFLSPAIDELPTNGSAGKAIELS